MKSAISLPLLESPISVAYTFVAATTLLFEIVIFAEDEDNAL